MIPFTKMHGLGNDYVFIDAFETSDVESHGDLPALARALSDRRFGVGSDGLIIVAPPGPGCADADARMIMFNADGSEGAMCGNGLRCVVRLLVERGRTARDDGVVVVATKSGPRRARVIERDAAWRISVDMGTPAIELAAIPALAEQLEPSGREGGLDRWRLEGVVGGLVSMGNPHFVSFVEASPEPRKIDALGTRLETHAAFPHGMNVHFVKVVGPTMAEMVTWERGSGRTQACGTGACAALVAGVLAGRLDRSATVCLPGGELEIEWDAGSGRVTMTGPATEVFRGVWNG